MHTFGDDVDEKQQRNKTNDIVKRKALFFFSNIGGRLFVSFMNEKPNIWFKEAMKMQ